MKCLDDQKVRIGQAHIFAHDCDIRLAFAGCARVEERLERREVDRSNRQVELLEHLHIEVLRGEHDGHLIDRRRVGAGKHFAWCHVAEERDLFAHSARDLVIGAADDEIGLNTQ